MSALEDWDSILGKDERIIWQGRPSPKFKFHPRMIFFVLFGLFFAGFALVWMGLTATAGGFIWMIGIVHFSVGIGLVISTLFKPSYTRRRTWYTLSNKRGYIATALPFVGRKLRSYAIGPGTGIEFAQGNPPSIHFGTRAVRRNNRTVQEPHGFEYIADAPEVMRLIRDLQDPTTQTEVP